MLGEGQQRGEALATDGTHVVFGGAAVRLSVLTKPVLREEGSGAHVALVVSFDEVRLLLSRTCCTKLRGIITNTITTQRTRFLTMTEYDSIVTGVVFSRPDVVVTQSVVLQQGLHGVGSAADIAGVHGL